MRSHGMKTTSACFAVLCQLRGICRSVPRTDFQSLVWCNRDWTIAMQCWRAFHYTLHSTCNRWWTRPHGSSSRHLSAITLRCFYANYTGWKSHGGPDTYYKLTVLVYKCLHSLAPSYLADELHHPAESEFWRRLRSASSHELSVPRTRLNLRRPSISSRRCTDLEQSSAVYHICSVTSRLLLSVADILLWTLLLVISVVVPAKWHAQLWTLIYWHITRS